MNDSGELAVTKFAVEPVNLPLLSLNLALMLLLEGVVPTRCRRKIWDRFGDLVLRLGTRLTNTIDEATLRRSLFEQTGGSYPEVSFQNPSPVEFFNFVQC
jgi:hypothetical protein